MAEKVSAVLTAQLPAGIPWRLKTAEVISDDQWRMLIALMDTVVPSVQRESTAPRRKSSSTAYIPETRFREAVSHLRKDTVVLDTASEQDLDRYLSEKPSDNLLFQQVLKGMLHYLPPEKRSQLFRVLAILSTRAGALLLTGYATPITRLSIEDRTRVLNGWSNSYLYQIRGLFRQVTSLAKVVFTATDPAFHALSGLPITPTNWKPEPKHPYEFVQFLAPPPPPPPSSSQTATPPAPAEIETDVVIVGSGCGAGVCAKALSEAGHRVLVLDKGYHFDGPSLPMAPAEAFFHLFEGAAALSSDDASVAVVSGSCFGGGGTVNWGAALQTQGFVRDEWVRGKGGLGGLGFFGTMEFQGCLDRVCGQMGVHDGSEVNHGNEVLAEGARRLGWSSKKVPQNTGRGEHSDGHCGLGCASGGKKGPVDGWFPDAARRGARFAEGFMVKRVLFDEKVKSKRVVGVVGTWTSRGKDGQLDGPDSDKVVREVIVRAKKVIISSGTLWSPIILKNSGLKASTIRNRSISSKLVIDFPCQNPQIGRNLYLHPVSVLHGFFREDVRPWEGDSLTSVVNTFENLDGRGHGARLECLSMMPFFAFHFLNWSDGVDFKLLALKYRHMNSYIALVRDRDPGYVYADPDSGQPRIVYTPSAFDRESAMVGLVALAKILYLQGALEIHAALPGMRPFIRDGAAPSASTTPAEEDDDIISTVSDAGVADPRFRAWLAELGAHGNKPPLATFASAHQMGTCRMSSAEGTGVVDPRGRVWGTEGLYVSDASVFPSASGVNPMVTTMAISDWISRNVVEDLRRDGNRERGRAQL